LGSIKKEGDRQREKEKMCAVNRGKESPRPRSRWHGATGGEKWVHENKGQGCHPVTKDLCRFQIIRGWGNELERKKKRTYTMPQSPELAMNYKIRDGRVVGGDVHAQIGVIDTSRKQKV